MINLFVMDMKAHINLVFVGHVDAGKSSLAGSILIDSGRFDERTIAKIKQTASAKGRESWWKAYFLDINEDEQEKGKTVEVAREHFETKSNQFTILDAPGHRAYVPNMIQGATQADVAILVISARKGEFEAGFQKDGQTCEHILLCKTFGVSKVIVAVNKMDVCDWNQKRFEEIRKKLGVYLKKTGFKSESVSWIPISAIENVNISCKLPKGIAEWYATKNTLMTELDNITIDRTKDLCKPFRMPILDTMKETGKLKVIGKVESGKLQIGDILTTNNNAECITVTELENEFGEMTTTSAGDNVTMTVSGELFSLLIAGDILKNVKDKTSPFTTREFLAQFKITDLPSSRPIFSAGISAVLHVHTCKTEAECSMILYKFDKKKKVKTNIGNVGDILVGSFRTQESVSVEKFEEYPQMGRFSLRDEGKTLCIGKILKVKPIDN